VRYNVVMTIARKSPRRKSERQAESAVPRIPGVTFLTAEEAWAMYDREAREALGMSAEEFDTALAAGKFDSRIEEPSVLRVYMIRAPKPGT
jgi:hypothetical protein